MTDGLVAGSEGTVVGGEWWEHGQAPKGANKANGLGGCKSETSSPSSKSFPTSIPLARKGLFLGMSSLVSLNMLHTPNMKPQCKLICDRGGGRWVVVSC